MAWFQVLRSLFLSTLSLRRATKAKIDYKGDIQISIHALLAESDKWFYRVRFFFPRFLSTLSLRRATVHYDNYNLHCVISIHALLAESDSSGMSFSVTRYISIHALLAESDMLGGFWVLLTQIFLSTLSLRRATVKNARSGLNILKFLSTLSLRRATPSENVRSSP